MVNPLHRLSLELALLGGLLFLIYQVFPDEPFYATLALLPSVTLGFLALVGGVFYFRWRQAQQRAHDAELLRIALWDVIGLMENYPVKSSSRRAAGRVELAERLAVRGVKEANAGRMSAMGTETGIDLSTLPLDLIDRNEADGSGHWRRVNGIRRACRTLIALIELGSPSQAYRAMIEHMKVQRDDAKGLNNFSDLKRLLGLPEQVPSEGWRWLEGAEITLPRALAVERMLTGGGLEFAFKGLFYKPWPEGNGPEVVYEGREEILKQFREYIR